MAAVSPDEAARRARAASSPWWTARRPTTRSRRCAHPLGEQAAVTGHVTDDPPGIVQLKTAFGGRRIVDLLVGDPLPRIC